MSEKLITKSKNAEICPSCEGLNIDHEILDFDDGRYYQRITCTDCKTKWICTYALHEIEITKGGDT